MRVRSNRTRRARATGRPFAASPRPCWLTVTVSKSPDLHERRRQDRRRGDGDDVDAARLVDHRGEKPGVCRVGRRGGPHVSDGEIGPVDRPGLSRGISAVQVPRGRQRGAVHGFGQLRLHHIGPAGIDGDARKEQEARQRGGHINKDEATLAGSIGTLFLHVRQPFRKSGHSRPGVRNRQSNTAICGIGEPEVVKGRNQRVRTVDFGHVDHSAERRPHLPAADS